MDEHEDRRDHLRRAEDIAAQVAFERGVQEARIEARLLSHDDALARINASVAKIETTLTQVAKDVNDQNIAQMRRDAAADAVALDLAKRNKDQITRREFTIATLGLVLTLIGLIITVLLAH